MSTVSGSTPRKKPRRPRTPLAPQRRGDTAPTIVTTDMAMTIDAVDLLYQGKVDGFGIMSSDSDFTPLVTRLRQDGLIVYGFGSTSKTPAAFKSACTRFIDIDALIKSASDEPDAPKSEAAPGKSGIDDELVELLDAEEERAARCRELEGLWSDDLRELVDRGATAGDASVGGAVSAPACRR